MRLTWIVSTVLLVIPVLEARGSEKEDSTARPQLHLKIRPERKEREKPKGKGFFVQLDWSAARGTSLQRQAASVVLHEGETFEIGGLTRAVQTAKLEETLTCGIEVGITVLKAGKVQLTVGSRKSLSETSWGMTRRMESHRAQSVEGVVLDKPVKVDLGLDENTGYRDAFEVTIQEEK